jgi:Transposase DDE domain
MLSIVYESRSIPIYFELLPKLGSSNFGEQIKFMSEVLPVLNKYKIVILGDREFCSVSLANWLREKNVAFCLRLKKNENIEIENGIWCQLNNLGLKPGVSIFIKDVKVTKTKQISGFNIAGKWKRKVCKYIANEGWFILTNLDNLDEAISSYKKRFNIEEMFRDFKSGGYNMEKDKAHGSRFTSLVLLITFAYSHATFTGKVIKKNGVQNYVARVKEYGRIKRRHSNFYVGLYSQIWLGFIDLCWDLIEKIMRINRNKIESYLRGMRAMALIQSTF